jgi:hypothetical protein
MWSNNESITDMLEAWRLELMHLGIYLMPIVKTPIGYKIRVATPDILWPIRQLTDKELEQLAKDNIEVFEIVKGGLNDKITEKSEGHTDAF